MANPTFSPRVAARVGAVILLGVLGVACGADGSSADLSELGEEGRKIANSNGCAACHGADGQGSVGPPFVGLLGSTRTFEDGSTTTADLEYIERSIREPSAQVVDGFNVQMPTNNLTDEEIEAVIQWIVDLAGEPSEQDT